MKSDAAKLCANNGYKIGIGNYEAANAFINITQIFNSTVKLYNLCLPLQIYSIVYCILC